MRHRTYHYRFLVFFGFVLVRSAVSKLGYTSGILQTILHWLTISGWALGAKSIINHFSWFYMIFGLQVLSQRLILLNHHGKKLYQMHSNK